MLRAVRLAYVEQVAQREACMEAGGAEEGRGGSEGGAEERGYGCGLGWGC